MGTGLIALRRNLENLDGNVGVALDLKHAYADLDWNVLVGGLLLGATGGISPECVFVGPGDPGALLADANGPGSRARIRMNDVDATPVNWAEHNHLRSVWDAGGLSVATMQPSSLAFTGGTTTATIGKTTGALWVTPTLSSFGIDILNERFIIENVSGAETDISAGSIGAGSAAGAFWFIDASTDACLGLCDSAGGGSIEMFAQAGGGNIAIDQTCVLKTRQAAVADPAATVGSLQTAVIAILNRMRATPGHGMIFD